ncbi:MAG: zinc dependent phospholipase C family protein [Promethearchaeota archaeon]
MKKRIKVLTLLFMFLGTLFIFVPGPRATRAWGLATHMFIVNEAVEGITNDSWAAAFDYYSIELISGSTTPDQAWQDWVNHLYYPETGYGNAPQAAARWYNYTRDNFTAGNWEAGFFAMGVMSHYVADPHIPIHTDDDWTGHSGYEADINENLLEFDLNPPTETLVSNVSQIVVDGATFSHPYYDTVVAAYPTSEDRAIDTNPTIKAFTEDCLSLAINSTLALYYNLTHNIDAPDVSYVYNYIALVDYAHSNDYILYEGEDKLTELNKTLARKGFEMRKQTTPFTVGNLTDVDLLIITCALDAYTAAELTAISDWAASGNKGLIITGRGDHSAAEGYINIARPNSILNAIGAHIRINEDTVNMMNTYQPWYIDITDIPVPNDALNLTFGVDAITFYSPASLYFTEDNPVMPIVITDETGYQVNDNTPPIEVIYDNTADALNGDQIPLAAVEEIGNLRLLTTGTTIFSNFDYGKADTFDNIIFLENVLDWAVGDRGENTIPDVDEVGPRISDVQVTLDGTTITVSATVTDPGAVSAVELKYNRNSPVTIPMETSGNHLYVTQIANATGTVELWIEAEDDAGNTAIRAYFTVVVSEEPGGIDWIIVSVGIAAAAVVMVIIILVIRKR